MSSAEKSLKSDRVIVLAIAAAVVVVIAGVALVALVLARKVNRAPVIFEVTATYKGADELTVKSAVAAPIIAQVNGVENLTGISANCTGEGSCTLTVAFRPGSDPAMAQVLLQNRVALATPLLPEAVREEGITVIRRETDASIESKR